jgi:uncharacterized protein (TIGR00725 family)
VTDGPYVAVVGSGTATGDLYEKARTVGRLVTERGGTLVCGGLSGVMEAAARGATEAGGVAIGILPDEDRRRQNAYLTFSVATGTGQARNLAVGRPVVVLEGWDLGEHVRVAPSPLAAVEAAFDLTGR